VLEAAISSQDWSGEAAVDVSIVNWAKSPLEPPTRFVLDGASVSGITTSLRPAEDADIASARKLAGNRGKAFIGQYVRGSGFILSEAEAQELLVRRDAEYRAVVRPFLNADDLTREPQQRPTRWIIDFGLMSLEEARTYPAGLKLVRERVKPKRDKDSALRATGGVIGGHVLKCEQRSPLLTDSWLGQHQQAHFLCVVRALVVSKSRDQRFRV